MNKPLKQYLENTYNKESNFEAIKNKIKKEKDNKINLKKTLGVVAVLLIIILMGSYAPSIYAKIQLDRQFEEYKRRDYQSGSGAISSEYNEELDMEYIYQDGYGIKIDSVILTDDTLKARVNVKIPEELNQKYKFRGDVENGEEHNMMILGFAIYDDENRIYNVCPDVFGAQVLAKKYYMNYSYFLHKELGVKYSMWNTYKNIIAETGGQSNIEKNGDEIITELELTTTKKFPKSKKLYIRIFSLNICTIAEENEIEQFIEKEWNFEIEMPEKFIERETINLVLLDEIPKLKIEKFTITETGTVLKARKKDVRETMGEGMNMTTKEWTNARERMLNITDAEENIYFPVMSGTIDAKDGFYGRFEIDKDIFENTTLYLNISIDGESYSSEIAESD